MCRIENDERISRRQIAAAIVGICFGTIGLLTMLAMLVGMAVTKGPQ